MQNWLIYGIIASFCFALNTFIYKVAVSKGNGLNPYLATLSVGIGVFLFFAIVYFVKLPSFTSNWTGLTMAVLAGVLWALGFFMVSLAIANKGNITQLAPIYNTNTLIVVLLGIIFLKEIPSLTGIIKIIAGAILIIIGSILVVI